MRHKTAKAMKKELKKMKKLKRKFQRELALFKTGAYNDARLHKATMDYLDFVLISI